MNPLLSKLYPELDGILGGSARTASRAARQPEEPKYEFTPEDERSLLGTLRDKSIGGLAAVGNLLDVPGSMVRDVATWLPGGPKPTNPFDQLLSPMSSDNRTTGRDLARGYGLASKKDTWGNFGGGLAAEIALDPLTYLTLGASALSKTGQAAKAAGLSDDLLKVAARKAGKKVGDVGKREARLTTTLDDFIKYGDEATQLKASELAKTHASDEAMGGLFGYNKPFSAPSGVLGTGDTAVKIAKKMDDIGSAIHYGKIPGTEFAPIAASRSLLDATVAGATDKWKSNVNRQAFRAKEKAAGLARAESAFQMQKLVDAGAGSEEYSPIIRMMVEGVDPTSTPGLAHMAKPWADAQADLKKWGAIQEVAQRQRDTRDGMIQAEGLKNNSLDDQMIEYAHRALTSDSKWKASREKRVAGGSQSSDMGRIDSIRDVPGGTEAVSQLARDFANEMKTGTLQRPDLKVSHIAKWLKSKHGWIGDNYRTSKVVDEPVIDATTGLPKMKEGPLLLDPQGNPYIDPATRMPARGPDIAVTRKVKKLVPTTGRFNALARDLASMSDETLEKGIFGNHVVRDMESRMLSHQATVASRDAFTDALSQPGILSATSKNARSKKGENVSLARLAADLGYKTGDENSGIVRLIKEQAGKTQGNPLASLDVKDIRKMTVPKDVAEGMRNYVKLTQNPEALDEILGAVDSVVNFSKGMWTSPWLAFHGRNTLSGSVHNFLKGMWDRKSFADSNAISKGRVIKDLDKEEWIQKEWAKDWAARGVPAPGLDELEANKFLGRLLYKHQVVGRHNSEAQSIVGKAVSKEDIHSGTLQDLRNSVPGPGVESFNVARTAKKYFGATPETTLDPRKATIRGVRGATESTFGPMAAGEELGKYAEDLNRITPFLNLARKGTNLDEAAKQVHVAQVQYGNKNYTPFEQQTMARLFPFFKFCVPLDHEILTKRGWKTCDQLHVGEMVMGYDHDTGKIAWEELEAVNVFEHVGEINKYECRSTSFQWTDGHRWPVQFRSYSRVSQEEGTVKTRSKERINKWVTEISEHHTFICKGSFSEHRSILSDRLAAILGWIVSDGYFRFRGNHMEAMVYQSPKKHLTEIIKLLGTNPRKPHPITGVVCVPVSLDDVLALRKAGFGSKSDLSRIVGGLSRSAAEAMWQAMFDAEGTHVGATREQQLFIQSHKNIEVTEAFQMLCVMVGKAFSKTLQQPGMDQVNIRRARMYGKPSLIKRVPFCGSVWCPTTPSGAWVMRRGGSVVFTGNSKGVVPQIVKELMERPGGKLGALIRTQRSMQESGPLAPDYVRESASIPVNGLLGTPPEGTDRYITGLGLMHENPFAFGTTARSAGLELLSRMTPAIKAPLEWATGQSFFQKGPDGGRKLDDMDPILGRLASNFGLTDNPKGFAPDWIEQTVANSPVSVGLSKLKQFTDERKALGTGAVTKHIPGPAAALNLLTGINVTDVSPGSKDAILRDLLNDEMKGAGAGAFERIYFRNEDLEKMTPQERLNANKLQALANMLVKRAKERKLVKASESR